jgi:hypothetical protein
MRRFAVKALQSALSVGAGYEATPPGSFVDAASPRGYYIDFTAKTRTGDAADHDALLPADLAQVALGWWERHLAGESTADRFLDAARSLRRHGVAADGDLLWPYDVPVAKYGLAPPWYSALAQGQAASVLVRAHALTREPELAEAARRAVAPLLPGSRSGLVAATREGPVPEEAPSKPPSLILNGWIYALWGLWDVARGLDDDVAGAAFDASAACLRRTLQRYDLGWWSRYSLFPHRLPDLAKPFYHRLHADQLEMLNALVQHADFAAVAARWRRYDTPIHRMAVVAQKAAFAATR